MKVEQYRITLTPKPRGFHLITDEINRQLRECGIDTGVVHLFLQHSSASLSINENCDPDVREDMENFYNAAVDDSGVAFHHVCEGKDDMPAHIKSSLLGVSLSLPLTRRSLNLGTWQGIYLNEHRDYGGSRHIVATIIGQ